MTDGIAPGILYHYTNVEGMLGITRSKTLWATDTRFLNDRSEIRYPREVLATLTEKAKLGYDSSDSAATSVFGLVSDLARTVGNPYTFAACTCADGDLLSQWRGYGGMGGGYAIGLNRDRLSDIAFEQNFELFPVLYDDDVQREVLRTALNDCVEYMKQQRVQNTVAADVAETVMRIAFTESMLEIKNPHFREEKEWRLARTDWLERTIRPPTLFRAVGSGVVPYQEINLMSMDSSFDAFEVVVIGPTADPRLTAEAVRDLLNHRNLAHVRVELSEVPLRG